MSSEHMLTVDHHANDGTALLSAQDAYDGHHGLNGNHTEHMAALGLVDPAEASHIAVSDGDWFDPATWGGTVPGDGARVVIPQGITVDYGAESDASVFSVGIGGELRFATDIDSRLVVDTIVVAPSGRLEAGTTEAPVRPEVTVDIVFANNGAIDTDWDAQLLSRGLVSLGAVEMHGAEKTAHLKVASDPMAGDGTLTFAEPPAGWQVGDTIVVAGTEFDGWGWDNDIRDSRYRGDTHEVRMITAIDGATVTLDRPLDHDHGSPRDDLKTSVANYTRSVTLRSEDGAESAVHERGHVMFMGSDDVDVRYVAFDELGRTDKSERSVPVSSLGDVTPEANVQGRYSIHLHELGTADVQNPAILEGNAVYGGPGWGIAHHSSNALLHRNAVFDVFGSGFVAEKGDEIGTWSENISIGTEGLNRLEKDLEDVLAFDLGRTGSGYWFQGRMVEAIDNVAAGARTGYVWMTRGDSNGVDPLLFDQPEALGLGGLAFPNHPVINNFTGNETFGSERGLIVVKANPNQGHDLRTVMEDFTAWEVRTGAHFEYTSHYTLRNFDVVAAEYLAPFTEAGTAIEVTTNTSDIVIDEARIHGFRHAYELSGAFTFPTTVDQNQFVVIGGEVTGLTGSVFEGNEITSGRVRVLDSAEAQALEVDVTSSVIGYSVPERSAVFTGLKSDSLGSLPVAAGTDDYRLDYDDVRAILETDGYFDLDGRHVFVAEAYYQDRLTGEIVKVGHLVDGVSTDIFSNPFGLFRDAVFNGAFPADNLAPVAVGDVVETAFEEPLTVNVLANDSDPDGHAIRVDGMVQPSRGKVFDLGNGQLRYVPDLDFAGSDSFEYWVTDGYGAFTKAEVEVLVGEPVLDPPAPPEPEPEPDPAPQPDPVPAPDPEPDPDPEPEPEPEPENRAPDAVDLTLIAISGAQVFSSEALLAASSDPDGDPIAILGVSEADGGAAALNGAGGVAFEPSVGAYGDGAGGFTIRVGDGRGGEDTARITLNLPEAPMPPDAVDDVATVSEDGPGILIDVMTNDAPGDATPYIAKINGTAVATSESVTLASGASLVLADLEITYDPGAAFDGLNSGETALDVFTYTLESDAGTDTATVRVTITGEDEPAPPPDPEPAPEPEPVPPPEPEPEAIGEAGILTLSQPSRDSWVRVEFEESLDNPSVVVGPLTANGGQPAVMRVRNVTDSGFEVKIDEWGYLNGRHMEEVVSWLAISEGEHVLSDGRTIIADTGSAETAWTSAAFGAEFATTPVVLGQVTSESDTETVALRIDDVTADGFRHRLQEAEASDDVHLSEIVSWIAIEAGTGSLEAGWTDRGVNHRRSDLDFETDFDDAPALLASMQTSDGMNTASLRLAGDDWDSHGASLRVEEERSLDRETWHVREEVGFVALETGLLFGETA